MRERRPRARLHGPKRNSELVRDLALGEVAPVGEGDHLALALGQRLERAVDAPLHPRALGALVRAGVERRLVGRLRGRLMARAAAIDDRVARDAVQPRGAGPAFGLVRPCGAPDRDERLLQRVLRAAAIAEAAQREPEDGTRVPLV